MSTKDPRHYDVIMSPVITEKSTNASEYNKIVFKVRPDATKPQIKDAVEKLFDVKVKSVNTLVRKGKVKAFKNTIGTQSNTKRAIVTLEEGHRIDVSSVLWGHSHGTELTQADDVGPAPIGAGGPFRALQGRAGQGADRGQAGNRRPQQ